MNKKILELIEERLLVGERKYGHQNITNDGRDFLKEALEEVLDLAVYVSAKLIEIINKEKKMGRAIDHDNRLDDHEHRIKLIEDALEEMLQTRVHHVDLVEGVVDATGLEVEGVEVEPDEEFRAPVVVKKRRKKAKTTA